MNATERQTFLDSLRVGDKIVYDVSRYGKPEYRVTTIKRITPKRSFITEEDLKFKTEGAYKIDSFSYLYMQPYTAEMEEKINRNKLERKTKILLYNLNISKLTDEKLLKLLNTLKEKE
jgi:hypothetical protein